MRLLFPLIVLVWMQAPMEPRVLHVSRREGIVEFESPVELQASVPTGVYLGLSMNGASSIQVQGIVDVRPGWLRGVATPASAGPVLFVLWGSELPALSTRTATAVVAGGSLRVVAARAAGPQTWLVGAEQGWDIVRPQVVMARVYVDGTTGLTYLLASGEMGGLPCPGLAVLYDVTTELRLIGRRATCDV